MLNKTGVTFYSFISFYYPYKYARILIFLVIFSTERYLFIYLGLKYSLGRGKARLQRLVNTFCLNLVTLFRGPHHRTNYQQKKQESKIEQKYHLRR
jgi:hypothetical protein